MNPRLIAGTILAAIAVAGAAVGIHEGREYRAYQDAGNVWTICEGHTRGVKRGDTATPEQCDEYKREDLERSADSVVGCLSVDPTVNQLAAFIDFEFNTGRFCGSSIQRKANAGDMRGACQAIGLYVYAAGQDCRVSRSCRGIVKRREEEIALCWPDFGNVESGSETNRIRDGP